MKAPIILVLPPFSQLNGPYPSIYYLRSFLEKRKHPTQCLDQSIGLFHRIFCRGGLEKIFHDLEERRPTLHLAPDILYQIDERLSEKELWINHIDALVLYLRGQNHAWGHLAALANGTLPGGFRYNSLVARRQGELLSDDAPRLASALLSDMADCLSIALDPSFSLISYQRSLGESYGSFDELTPILEGYIMEEFYKPYLEEVWDSLEEQGLRGDFFLGLSVPYTGCLAAALVCAASGKARFAEGLQVVMGGGYVNTDLRFLEDPRLFDYIDYLSFDRGYGSWDAILSRGREAPLSPLYKTLYREGGDIIRDDSISTSPCSSNTVDDEAVQSTFPDYSGIDAGLYLCPVDDRNPMHRLWTDGIWLKAYLAYGCYWHSCAFCDTSLDYIRTFIPLDARSLYRHLLDQSEKTGIRGVHLVDEAAPLSSLIDLAECNIEQGCPLFFWANIRFERDFSADTALLLARGGFLAFSAGIEVASEAGFKRIGKGIGLPGVVRAAAAFKEAGILVHAYLIYGYWDEGDQEVFESACVLGQLFEQGLLDSAFWHRFILTCHSRVYHEWERGRHKNLQPIERVHPGPRFARNDLEFRSPPGGSPNQNHSDRWGEILDSLLALWMGEGDASPENEASGDEIYSPAFIRSLLPFPLPGKDIEHDRVLTLLDSYVRDKEASRRIIPGEGEDPGESRVLFLGSRPLLKWEGRKNFLWWKFQLQERELGKEEGLSPSLLSSLGALLSEASRPGAFGARDFYQRLQALAGGRASSIWIHLRERGLVSYERREGRGDL